MKTTIDIPDDIYRQVKAKSALEGRAVREVAIDLFKGWVEGEKCVSLTDTAQKKQARKVPPWFGCLNKYVIHAKGRHDMGSIRKSIARGLAKERQL